MATKRLTRTGEQPGAGSRPRRWLPLWAWELAQRQLAGELPERWAHVQGVARVGARVGRTILTPAERDLLVAAALLHDIGYAAPLTATGYHPLDGARYVLTRHGEPRVANLVANHSAAAAIAGFRGFGDEITTFPDERTALRDALWYSDMRVGPSGLPVTFDERIADIRRRHGQDSALVRALDAGALDARRDAVRRTERRLAQAVGRARA